MKKRRKRTPEQKDKIKKLKAWSREVRTHDDWKCVYCGKTNKRLNAHHLLPKQIYPQFQFDPKIGISLCPWNCHKRRAHYDAVAFTIWLMEHRPEQFEYIKKLLKEK